MATLPKTRLSIVTGKQGFYNSTAYFWHHLCWTVVSGRSRVSRQQRVTKQPPVSYFILSYFVHHRDLQESDPFI